ncbi:MAG: hypothetical protein PHS74_10005 [Lachnospiraceae bacterium]|nr:hypothetical protein [Lachnospiraceae bacterium]
MTTVYLDCAIEIPDVPGKINQVKNGNTTYIREYGIRQYRCLFFTMTWGRNKR